MLHIWSGGFKDQTVRQTFGIPHGVSFDVVDRLSSKVLSSYHREDVNIITVNPFGHILFAFRAEAIFILCRNAQGEASDHS